MLEICHHLAGERSPPPVGMRAWFPRADVADSFSQRRCCTRVSEAVLATLHISCWSHTQNCWIQLKIFFMSQMTEGINKPALSQVLVSVDLLSWLSVAHQLFARNFLSSHLNRLVFSRWGESGLTVKFPTAEIDSIQRKSGEKECKCTDGGSLLSLLRNHHLYGRSYVSVMAAAYIGSKVALWRLASCAARCLPKCRVSRWFWPQKTFSGWLNANPE